MDEQTSAPVAAQDAPATEPKRKTRTMYLSEAAALDAGSVDAKNYTVDVVLIRPGWSANGRYYGRDTLTKSIGMFEGVKAFADHPGKSEEADRPERSVRGITGYYTDVRQRAEDGALIAKRHVIGEARQWLWPLITEAIEHKPDLVGLSINALGKTAMGEAEGRKGLIVEDIVKGNSVDDVTTPAAGGRYERLAASADTLTADLLAAMDFDEWCEASKPEHVQRLREKIKTLRQDEAMAEATAKVRTLTESVGEREGRIKALEEAVRASDKTVSDLRAELARRDREQLADKLLSESKLPNQWQSATRAQLLATADTATWPALIEAEQVKYRSVATATVKPQVPVRGAGVGSTASPAAYNPVAEALGTVITPRDGESPQQYAERKKRMTRS